MKDGLHKRGIVLTLLAILLATYGMLAARASVTEAGPTVEVVRVEPWQALLPAGCAFVLEEVICVSPQTLGLRLDPIARDSIRERVLP